MIVYVINKNNRPLMPTTPRKARLLLKEGKAKIYKYEPFTIQLLFGSYGYTQPITLGIDTGELYKAIKPKQVTFICRSNNWIIN